MHSKITFPPEVIKALEYYVYRLIDPRNAETFYVGKGKGNRVFQHVAGKLKPTDEDEPSAKIKRILEIQSAGFAVQHVIHRHGLDNDTALEVEGALIDAYPSATNVAGGHGNADRGISHSNEIIERYTAVEVAIVHPAIEITVNRSSAERNVYDATRYAWRVDHQRAAKAEIALAVLNGLVIEVFQIEEWMPATEENFPNIADPSVKSKRFGFRGKVARDDVRAIYLRKKVPTKARGAANPIRYHNIS